MTAPLVIFTPSGKRGRVAAGTTVLAAARQLGVDLDSVYAVEERYQAKHARPGGHPVLKLRVAAPPVDGAANVAIVASSPTRSPLRRHPGLPRSLARQAPAAARRRGLVGAARGRAMTSACPALASRLSGYPDSQHPEVSMWSVQEARNQLSAVIDAALVSSPQVISRRGKPSVVMVSVEEYERLTRAAIAQRGSFIDQLLSIPPSENPDDDEDEFPRIQVIPRDVDL